MISLPYYTSAAVEDVSEVIRDTCTAVDLEAERVPAEQTNANPDSSVFLVSEDEWDFEIRFDSDSDGQVPVPEIVIAGTPWFSEPWENGVGDDEYQRRVDRLFELICRLAMALEVEYAPMLGHVDPMQVWPTDRPLAENVEELPIFGIYSESIFDELGGIQAMFERDPWYVATLPSGHTIVIQDDFPWNDAQWTPPRDADFLETVTFPGPGKYTQSGHDFEDPFAALETGAIGTDLCVPRERIGPEFRNEDLEPVRVRVDERRDLRRLDTGAFVRNVVDDEPGDPAGFMMAMLEEIPADATDDDLMVSALLHEAVPPAFVRLDERNDETVVTRVADLDVDVAKVDLLIRLGRIAREGEFTDEDLREMERFLETLDRLDDIEGIERRIRDRLR